MAALARWQGTITDSSGNVVASASVAVYSETTGALATIYSDRTGLSSISNPTTADADGFAAFYAYGDAYRIVASSGATSREFRYVGIGTASEEDKPLVTIAEATLSGEPFINFSGLNFYRRIQIQIDRLQVATDTASLYAFLSTNGGSSYIGGTSNLYTLNRATASTAALSGSAGAGFLLLSSNLGTGAGEHYQGDIDMYNHTDTSIYKYIHARGSLLDATPELRRADMEGLVLTGTAVTDIAIQASTGNISAKVRLLGELL